MKVLAYSCYYTPEIAASMYLTEDIYKGIVDAGHTLEVYVPMPTRGISAEVRQEYKKKKTEKKYNGKLIIHRITIYREGKNSVFRALRYLFLNVAFIWKSFRIKADVIFVQSTPPTQGMMAGLIGSLKHIPVVFNLQDIFPDSLVNANITSMGSLLWKIGRKIEDYSYRHARSIIVISNDFKKNIYAKGVPTEKIVVIPNWADISGVYPVDRKKNVLIKKYGLDPNKFYITYSGNVGYTQNMDLLLNTAKRVSSICSQISFVIIGDGADKERVEGRVKDEHIANVIMLPFQQYEDIAHVFSLGDVGLIISKTGVGDNSVPSKTWSIMAAEKPIIASFDENSELCRIINTHHCGVVCKADDEEDLINSVLSLYKRRKDLSELGNQGKKYLEKYLDKNKCIEQYIQVLSQACFSRKNHYE